MAQILVNMQRKIANNLLLGFTNFSLNCQAYPVQLKIFNVQSDNNLNGICTHYKTLLEGVRFGI